MTSDSGNTLFQDRYELGSVLGRGGTCTVYEAQDTRLQRTVAIKMLESPMAEDPQARSRFKREGKAIARLSHPNLVGLIDRGSTDETEYMVFEHVEGRSLKSLIKQMGSLETADAGQIAGQLAEGLSHAHLCGIVHRDVKPQNILLDDEGRAKLTDFGIATGPDWTQVTKTGAIIGSSRYMSPEQVQSRPVDARSDIYALGVVMYEMLTGAPPFDGASVTEIGRHHVYDKPAPLTDSHPEIPWKVERIILRCLEKMPESRFQSMDELLGALVGLDLYRPEQTDRGVLGQLFRRVRETDVGEINTGGTPPAPTGGGNKEGEEATSGESSWGGQRPPRDRRAQRDGRSRGGDRPARIEVKEVSYGAGRSSRTARLLSLAAVILIAGLAVAAFFLFSGGGSTPDVVGLTLEEARTRAEDADMEISVEEDVPRLDTTGGVVISQEPPVGAEKTGDRLNVTIARSPEQVQAASVTDYDPDGDNSENTELVARLTDEDPETYWATEHYGPGYFQESKSGVGIRFRLEEPTSLLEILSPDEGWTGAVLAEEEDGTTVELAPLEGSGRQTVTLEEPLVAGQIWIESLVSREEDDRMQVRIGEIRFYR